MISTFVLTRFATRPAVGDRALFGMPVDKLFEPARLALRSETLAMVTAPSLRAQTAQDFQWLIITDPMLPADARVRLEGIVADMPQAVIVRIDEVLQPGETIGSRRWLEPFVAPEATHVLTANLDNDDGLGCHFIERLRAQAEADIDNPKVSAVRLYGQGEARQWDMFDVEGAGFGAVKPWSRRDPWRRPYFLSPGYACCAPRHVDIQVLGVPHNVAHAAEDKPTYLKRSRWLGGPRRRYKPQESWFAKHDWLRACLEGLDALTPDRTAGRWVCMMDGGGNELLMLNHSNNAIAGRKSEKPEARRVVEGPEAFGEVVVDWARIARFFKDQTS